MDEALKKQLIYKEPVTQAKQTKVTRNLANHGLGWTGIGVGAAVLVFLAMPLNLGILDIFQLNVGVDKDSLIPFLVLLWLIGLGVMTFSARNVWRQYVTSKRMTEEGRGPWEWDHDWEAECFHNSFWKRILTTWMVLGVFGLIIVCFAMVFYMNMDIAEGNITALYIVGGIFGGFWLLAVLVSLACMPLEWKLKGLSLHYHKVPTFTGETVELGIQVPTPYKHGAALVVELRLIEEHRYKERRKEVGVKVRQAVYRAGEFQVWAQKLIIRKASEHCDQKGLLKLSFQVPNDQPGNQLTGALLRTWQVSIKPSGHWYPLEYHFLVPIYEKAKA